MKRNTTFISDEFGAIVSLETGSVNQGATSVVIDPQEIQDVVQTETTNETMNDVMDRMERSGFTLEFHI